MDANAFIEFLNLPFAERLRQHRAFQQGETERGSMMGRMGVAPVGTHQSYQRLDGTGFEDMLIFGSNNYLNLNRHPHVVECVIDAVHRFGVGTGGSPAFSGYTRQHHELELRLAALAGHDDAVLLPSGYMANLCWVNGLMTRKDVLLYDKHSHASVINAIKMTGVQFFPYDPDHLDRFEELLDEIRSSRPGVQVFATVEGVRSNDGSVIQLRRLLERCREQGIFVILDDAHGVGVLGRNGAGTLEHLDLMGMADMRMSTCSKALGAQGAWVSGSREAIAYLRAYAKPYVFTSALAQTTVAAIDAALDVLRDEPQRRARLHDNRRHITRRLESLGFDVGASESGIVPVYLPDGIAGRFNQHLHARGLFVNVMEYPMVAPGCERLRLSLMSEHTEADIDAAVGIMQETAQRLHLPLCAATESATP